MTGGAQFQFLHDVYLILSTKRNELVHNLMPTHVQFAIIVTAWQAKVQNLSYICYAF